MPRSELDKKLFLVTCEIDNKLHIEEVGGFDKSSAKKEFYYKFNKNNPNKTVKVLSIDEKYNNYCLEM